MFYAFSYISKFASLVVLALLAGNLSIASSQTTADDTRGLKPREYAQKLQNQITARRPRSKRPRNKGAVAYVPATPDNSPVAEGVNIGFTLWRLRQSRKADDLSVVEPTRIVKRKKGNSVEETANMTPERVESETTFADGDILRLSIEVPYEAYIYILNREQYADGSTSDPYLVFPARVDVGRSDKGIPGRLLYIPNELETFEVTRLSPDGPKKKAELFTVILAPQPLKELPPLGDAEENRKIDRGQLEQWERDWSGRVWKFERQGGTGKAITRVEKKAGATSGEPLTESDPPPQTVYHVARKPDEPVLFTIPVRIRE